MKKCDIIIPIYNAYECLEPCIDSVIKNTNLDENRIILIDDKSPDDRVLPLLEKYAKSNKSIILLKNDVNLGFVGTVNKGMEYSKENDVLLLNSDTEVTEKWLDKIKKCAYSQENIATVTPLSNNATLASVPKIFEPNDLPKNTSLEEMNKIIEKCSYNEIVEVPTGHGFCLFIKREALDIVGLFDVENYGRGYGEENDFCFRCLDAGFINVLCDNVYILHKESKSFKEEKTKLIEEGLSKLKEKYPEYKERLDLWCSKREYSYLGQNVALNIGCTNDKPNVLFVIHDWKDIKNNLGGTTLHAWDIINNLRDYFNFHVLTPEDGNYKIYSYWSNKEMETEFKYPGVEQFSIISYYNPKYREMIEKIVDDFDIQLIHIHHLIGNYFDIFDVAKMKNIYTVITLHDYYVACPRINKLYKNKYYCGDGAVEKCENCIMNIFKNQGRCKSGIENWRRLWHKQLQDVDLILTPSEASKKEILMTFPNLNIKVIEHGVDISKKRSELSLEDGELNIAFIGAIGIHKGSKLLLELTQKIKNKKIKIHLFGICNYQIKDNKNFINHGKYKRDELPHLLKENNIKLICLLSTWPETFSYTLTESIASGIPVLSFDFGAIAERIKKYDLGWVVPPDSDINIIIKTLKEILNDKENYSKIIQNINKYKYRTTKEMSEDYKKIYLNNTGKHNNVNYQNLKELVKTSNRQYSVINYSNYEWVFGTLKWRIISKIKLPRIVKKIAKRLKNEK